MRIPLVIVICALSIVLFNCKDKSTKTSDERRELLSLEYKWLENEFALDTAFLSSIMDSTFIGISEDGLKGKQEDCKIFTYR